MSSRPGDTDVRERLLVAATQLLAQGGRDALTARRLGGAVGASSMAVYTHFGSMDELMTAIWRRAFSRFGAALTAGAVTRDPVADWARQGFGYRRFALSEPNLYRVMFGDGLVGFRSGDPEDLRAAAGTFEALLERVAACVGVGRWQVGEPALAGEAIWSAVHGHCSIELVGYFEHTGRDGEAAFLETLRRLSRGFGDDPDATERSLATARRRIRRG